MTESLGTARLDIVVDTSQFDSAITAAKSRVSGMSQAAQQEYGKLNAAERRRIDTLLKQADTLGFTREQQIAYNAALRNTPTAILDDLRRKIGGVNQATQQGTTSVKQYNAALRGVPAQITDIFTSLQGGANPLTVLFQQGGQLKDMFGGIKPAASALGNSLAAVVTPATALGAAFAATALAAFKGSQESTEFAKALALTGNAAGVTTSDLVGMQAAIAQAGITQAKAAEALTAVAASGKFAGDQFRAVAEAAAAMEYTTGQSIDQTIEQFALLGKDPVEAVAKLNEAHHFLTAEVYEQIAALQEQGREQDAATVAMNAWADAVRDRTTEVAANLGFLEKRWRELGAGAAYAWDQMLGLGRAESLDQRIADVQTKIDSLERSQRKGFSLFDTSGQLAEARAERQRLIRQQTDENRRDSTKAALQGANDTAIALERANAAAAPRLKKLATERAKAIADVDKAATAAILNGDLALSQRIRNSGTARVAMIDQQIKEEQQRGKGRTARAARKPMSDAERASEQLSRAQESTNERLDRQIALYGKTGEAARLRYEVEQGALAALSQPEKDALLRKAETLDQMEEEKRLQDELTRAALKEADARDRANEQNERLIGDMQFEIELMRMGSRERERAIALRQLEAGATDEQRRAVEALAEQYARERGAVEAMDDFRQNFSDALFDLATGAKSAKDAIKDFFDEWARQITRAISQRWTEQLFGSMGQSGGGSAGGIFNWILSSLSGGGLGAGYAKGGAFENGNVLAFANGGVVTGPTNFPMSGGRLGLMGEAGPEAIMPLTRLSDGKLGVRAEPTAPGHSAPPILNQTFVVQGTPDRRTQEQMARESGREAARGMARTGR